MIVRSPMATDRELAFYAAPGPLTALDTAPVLPDLRHRPAEVGDRKAPARARRVMLPRDHWGLMDRGSALGEGPADSLVGEVAELAAAVTGRRCGRGTCGSTGSGRHRWTGSRRGEVRPGGLPRDGANPGREGADRVRAAHDLHGPGPSSRPGFGSMSLSLGAQCRDRARRYRPADGLGTTQVVRPSSMMWWGGPSARETAALDRFESEPLVEPQRIVASAGPNEDSIRRP